MTAKAARPTLLDAWREHCSLLTIKQLSSLRELREHFEAFKALVVSQGLQDTTLDGETDVLNVIASWAFDKPALPSADVLQELAMRTQGMIAAQVASEACKIAKKRSLEGKTDLDVALKDFPSGKKIYWNIEEDISEKILSILRSAGYNAHMHINRTFSIVDKNLRMSWAKAAH